MVDVTGDGVIGSVLFFTRNGVTVHAILPGSPPPQSSVMANPYLLLIPLHKYLDV